MGVVSGGFEHTSSHVYFQWLVPDSESEAGIRLVSSRVVEELSGGFYSVGQPLIKKVGHEFRVVISATDTYEPTRTAVHLPHEEARRIPGGEVEGL